MSKYIHERELGEVYAIELDVIAEMIEGVHPIGEVKAIGRLEVVAAIQDVITEITALREENRKLRKAWDIASPYWVSGLEEIWYAHIGGENHGPYSTRDEAIDVAAGIKQAADTAKGE